MEGGFRDNQACSEDLGFCKLGSGSNGDLKQGSWNTIGKLLPGPLCVHYIATIFCTLPDMSSNTRAVRSGQPLLHPKPLSIILRPPETRQPDGFLVKL